MRVLTGCCIYPAATTCATVTPAPRALATIIVASFSGPGSFPELPAVRLNAFFGFRNRKDRINRCISKEDIGEEEG